MITRKTPLISAVFTQLVLVPVIALTFVLFSGEAASRNIVNRKQPAAALSDTTKRPRLRPLPPTVFSNGGYPHTKAGVSTDLLNEYSGIVAKYSTNSGIKSESQISPEDRTRLEVIYKQMSEEQQRGQVIGFFYLAPPPPPFSPTKKQLDKWQNPKFCGVWIDDKKVDNNALSKYSPDDFSNYFISPLTPKAINYKNYKYQVGLMTAAYYKNYRAERTKERYKSFMSFRVKKSAND